VEGNGTRAAASAIAGLAVAVLLIATARGGVGAGDAPTGGSERRRPPDARRVYLYFQAGQSFQLDDHFTQDLEVDQGAFNLLLGGGGGYNIDDHWGIELQVVGTEPEIRSKTHGKVDELSNITFAAAVRYRRAILDGRVVPYVTAGLGPSLNDINDTADPRVKVSMDRWNFAGALSAGIDYFVAPSVALGIATQYHIYSDADTSFRETDPPRRVQKSSVDLTAVSLVANVRLFLGEEDPWAGEGVGALGRVRRLILAESGPFDTAERRVYLYALGGGMLPYDEDFALDVQFESPGGSNWLLGGGLGVNLDRHWGVEVQLVHTEPTLDGNTDAGGGPSGKLVEMSNLSILPGVRFRYPFRDGRLVPFVSGHVGAALNFLNDHRTDLVDVGVQDSTVAGAVVAGFEYFLNRHLSFGLSVPLYIYPDWTASVERHRRSAFGPIIASDRSEANYSGVALLMQLKAYVP
jgi:opacity protein-like surface antigen